MHIHMHVFPLGRPTPSHPFQYVYVYPNPNAGFVYQEDLFIPTMTVKEHLTFHAMVRMDANIPGTHIHT